jgi:hypothetical protein
VPAESFGAHGDGSGWEGLAFEAVDQPDETRAPGGVGGCLTGSETVEGGDGFVTPAAFQLVADLFDDVLGEYQVGPVPGGL